MAIAVTLDESLSSAKSVGTKLRERIKIVGTTGAAADTGTVQLKQIGRNAVVLGGAFVKSAETATPGRGASITVKAIVALGNDTAYVEVEGDLL